MTNPNPNQAPLLPEPEPAQRTPMLLTMADVTAWDIGPSKDSDCMLKLTFAVPNFENTKLIRALAAGRVILRVLPLQLRLADQPGGLESIDPEGCPHTGEKWQLGLISGRQMECCMSCGLVMEKPQDDAPAAPEGPEDAPPEEPQP